VRHNILRDEYWIYNTEIDGYFKVVGVQSRFVKLNELPDQREVVLIEWKVIDVLNIRTQQRSMKLQMWHVL
jgi:hypothetical protein